MCLYMENPESHVEFIYEYIIDHGLSEYMKKYITKSTFGNYDICSLAYMDGSYVKNPSFIYFDGETETKIYDKFEIVPTGRDTGVIKMESHNDKMNIEYSLGNLDIVKKYKIVEPHFRNNTKSDDDFDIFSNISVNVTKVITGIQLMGKEVNLYRDATVETLSYADAVEEKDIEKSDIFSKKCMYFVTSDIIKFFEQAVRDNLIDDHSILERVRNNAEKNLSMILNYTLDNNYGVKSFELCCTDQRAGGIICVIHDGGSYETYFTTGTFVSKTELRNTLNYDMVYDEDTGLYVYNLGDRDLSEVIAIGTENLL